MVKDVLGTAAVAACTDHESSCWLLPHTRTQESLAGRGAALRLGGLFCVGILTLLPIKTLIYLAQKLPPKKNHFPVSVPSAYEEEF